MTGTIQTPSKGDGLKAAWGASVANGLNALMPMGPALMLVREGAGGVGCEPLPQNLRDRKAAANPDRGRYRIASVAVNEPDDEDDVKTLDITLANPYYRCGGETFEGSATSLTEVELPAIVALKVDITGSEPSDELVAYASVEELRTDELDRDFYVAPLFEFSEDGVLVCDFRIGPDHSMFEFTCLPPEDGQ